MLTIISLCIGILGDNIVGLILSGMFTILLVPYILHYYTLENEVQKMYEQYDKLIEIKKGKESDN